MLTKGCRRFFPIGYIYLFKFFMEYTVHHNITPDNRSNKESIVDAMMANDLLTMEAYTFEINNTTFAAFDRWIAQLSPHFSALRSS